MQLIEELIELKNSKDLKPKFKIGYIIFDYRKQQDVKTELARGAV